MGTGAAIGAGERARHAGYYSFVMPGHSRSKNGVASLAYVPGIHVLLCREPKDVDGRDKPGHDARGAFANLCKCAIDCWLKSPRRRFAAKKLQEQKHFDFRCLRGCCESIRRSRLTFFSVPTNCATVSLNKGAF
jgi:hypothetical protein